MVEQSTDQFGSMGYGPGESRWAPDGLRRSFVPILLFGGLGYEDF